MKDKLVAIHLHGPLGQRFGDLHHYAIRSPREAIRALDANYPGFVAAFAEHERYGILVDDDWREGELAAIGPVSREVHFVPVSEGNVPIIAVGLTTAFGLSATAATILGSVLLAGLMIGISLMFRPKTPKQDKQEKDESFIFTGPENVTGQGVAVPLIYGRVFAGSVVVSAGQDTVDTITTPAVQGAPVPKTPSVAKPKNPATGTDYPPPNGRASDHVARARATAFNISAFEDEEPPPWPDVYNAGAGTDHLRGDPVEGWPPIISDPVYSFKPEGWIPSKYTWATEENDVNRKQVMVWQPDYETEDYVYNWNMVRGFYVTDVGVEAEQPEWIDGAQMEVPIKNPSP